MYTQDDEDEVEDKDFLDIIQDELENEEEEETETVAIWSSFFEE